MRSSSGPSYGNFPKKMGEWGDRTGSTLGFDLPLFEYRTLMDFMNVYHLPLSYGRIFVLDLFGTCEALVFQPSR